MKWNEVNYDEDDDINEIDNNTGVEGARMINEGLKCNCTMKVLWLGGYEKEKGIEMGEE